MRLFFYCWFSMAGLSNDILLATPLFCLGDWADPNNPNISLSSCGTRMQMFVNEVRKGRDFTLDQAMTNV